MSRRQASRKDWVCRIFDTREHLMAHVVGVPYHVELEEALIAERVDHVEFTLQVPPCGTVLVSVNTVSRLNRLAGFDPRLRIGIVRTKWEEKPEPFMDEFPGLDYAHIEEESLVYYEAYAKEELEKLLIEKGRAAVRVEAWGELYRRERLGMHQIHSRRASSAVPRDIVGRDGAMRFYLPDHTAELFLFKYHGQP